MTLTRRDLLKRVTAIGLAAPMLEPIELATKFVIQLDGTMIHRAPQPVVSARAFGVITGTEPYYALHDYPPGVRTKGFVRVRITNGSTLLQPAYPSLGFPVDLTEHWAPKPGMIVRIDEDGFARPMVPQ